MLTFLFWNIAKKPLQQRVARMVSAHGVDVLMLAECALDPAEVLDALNTNGGNWGHQQGVSVERKVGTFVRSARYKLKPIYEDPNGRLAIDRFRVPRAFEMLLATAHLPSRVN